MSESDKEDYSPLGIIISVFLLFVLSIQIYCFAVYYINGNDEVLMAAGILSLIGVLFWVPGYILGYKITTKLKNKAVGYTTIFLSTLEFLILVWTFL